MAEISLSEFNNQPKPDLTKRYLPNSHFGLLAVAAVVVAGISFAAGMQYQKGKAPITTTAGMTVSQNGAPGGGFRRNSARAFGTVSSVSSSSITLQTRNGSTRTYNVTSSTTVTDNGQSSSISNIQNGDTVVLALDTSNTQDVTSIIINPSFGGGFNSSPSGDTPAPSDGSSDTTSGSTMGI